MVNFISRCAQVLAAFIIAAFSINLIAFMDVYADANPPAGNNGTLKVHEKGTPDKTESNSPKVCAFNFESFSFDPSQTGYIVVSPKDTSTATVTLPFGPTDNTGYAASAYINDGVSGYSVPNDQYEATLYGKDTGNPSKPNLQDQKAKSKVFKVECASAPTVSVQVGPCVAIGMANGTASGSVVNTADTTKQAAAYTITATNQVTLAQKTTTVTVADGASGNFNFSGLSTGTYTLTVNGTDQTSATTTFTIATCVIMPPIFTPVAPEAANHIDLCGTNNDTYTIPSKTGVNYYVNGSPTAAGTYTASGSVIITVMPAPGFMLSTNPSWTFTFDNTGCTVTPDAPMHIDTCGKKNDSYTIPAVAGVDYYVNGSLTAAGIYKKAQGTIVITAVAQTGYRIEPATPASWTINFKKDSCKVTICHRTASYTNPYNKIRVSLKAVDGAGKGDHYKQHQGPIFNPSLPLGTEWGDIIPPTTVQTAGLNWTAEGEAIWNTKDCDVVLVEATPAEPTFTDKCDVQNDTYTIPATPGVNYFVNGSTTAATAGTYPASGTITIVAIAKDGYVLKQNADATWTYTYNTKACPKAVITASADCTMTGASVVLKNSGDADGSVYVNGTVVVVPAGSQVEKPISLLDFKAQALVTTEGETVLLDQAIDCTPGRGNITPKPETPSTTIVKPTPQTGTLPKELPMTGPSSPLSQMATMIVLAIGTYIATYYLQGRRLAKENE